MTSTELCNQLKILWQQFQMNHHFALNNEHWTVKIQTTQTNKQKKKHETKRRNKKS